MKEPIFYDETGDAEDALPGPEAICSLCGHVEESQKKLTVHLTAAHSPAFAYESQEAADVAEVSLPRVEVKPNREERLASRAAPPRPKPQP